VSPVKALVVRPKVARTMLAGCGKHTLAGLIKAGKLDAFKEGKAVWITVASIEQYIQRKLQESHLPK
jgi:replication-associated recombination protein RarA